MHKNKSTFNISYRMGPERQPKMRELMELIGTDSPSYVLDVALNHYLHVKREQVKQAKQGNG